MNALEYELPHGLGGRSTMNNNPIDPWIAEFVDQCLSCYLSPKQNGIEVKNDGTALRFKIHGLAGQAVVSDVSSSPRC